MSDNIAEIEKTDDEKVASETLMQSPFPSGNSMLFQVFFLTHDQSQNVEVVETEKIDCEEIIHRLKMGESVFIKSKDPESYEPSPKKEGKHNPWYFTRC